MRKLTSFSKMASVFHDVYHEVLDVFVLVIALTPPALVNQQTAVVRIGRLQERSTYIIIIIITEIGNKKDYISCRDFKFHAILRSSDS